MNETILELAAALLSLFCLTDCLIARREQYLPPLRSPREGLRNQHAAFLLTLGVIVPTSAAAIAAGKGLGLGAGGLLLLRTAYHVLHAALPCLLSLYVLALSGQSRRWKRIHLLLFALPFATEELLLLSNPFHRLCFDLDEALVLQPGPCFPVIHLAAALYLLLTLFHLLPGRGSLSRTDRIAATGLVSVIALGRLLQVVWSVPVELFFAAVTLFGMMILLEQGGDANPSNRSRFGAMLALSLTFLLVIVMNVSLIRGITGRQSDLIGNTQLDVIGGELQGTVTQAETDLLRVTADVRAPLDATASREELAAYLDDQRQKLLSHDSFMNVYVGGQDGTSSRASMRPPTSTPPSGCGISAPRSTPGRCTSPSPIRTPTPEKCASPSPRCSPMERQSWAWTSISPRRRNPFSA